MPNAAPSVIPPGDNQSIAQQIAYLEQMWDRICASPEAVPLPTIHIRLAVQRLADHASDPGAARPMAQLIDEAEASCR